MATTCPLKNKDFYGTVQYDPKDETGFPFHGQVIGTDMKYNGRTAQELTDSFHLTIERCADTPSSQLPLPRMVQTSEIEGMLHDFSTTDQCDILPALRQEFERFIQLPAKYDNDFPSSIYNLHRLVQHAKTILLDHLSKYAVVNCGVVIYTPEFIPDIPDYNLTLGFGAHTDTYVGGLRSLRNELPTLVKAMDTSSICSATLDIKCQFSSGRVMTTEEFTVQFPDIL